MARSAGRGPGGSRRALPPLAANGLPQLGTTLSLQLGGAPAFGLGFTVFATDRTQWLTFPTPVELSFVGAPGCFMQTSTDILDLVVFDGAGQGSSSLAIPSNPLLVGFTFHNQAAVLSPGVNALGVLLGNAGTAVVGN
jgi:hypothetical protein